MDLKVLRKEKNFTISQVAKLSNISDSFYCQIENKKRKPSVSSAKSIAKVLGFNWSKFFE